MNRVGWRGFVATIVAFIMIAGGAFYYFRFNSGKPPSEIWSGVSWRAQLYLRKASGRLPELSWIDLYKTTVEPGGFSLKDAVTFGQSVRAALTNPYTSPEDREAGGQIYSQRCALCHGLDGTGGRGPSLARFGYKNGDSNVAVYRVLTDGIAGTAMAPMNLSFSQRWQVVGYLRDLQLHSHDGVDETPSLNVDVSSEQIRKADANPGEWLTYSGSLTGRRYSALSEITPANVSQLRVRWVYQSATSDESAFESTPLVVSDTIFVTEPPANVVALDAKTGRVIWKYERLIPANLPISDGKVNRGLAILRNSLFFGSIDGYLVAINANTGTVVWQTQVASPSEGFSITGAPLVVNHSVVIGASGGEFGVRGFLAAYDGATGKQEWRFNTIPGPGEVGHEAWQNEAWKGGGGATWVTGSYDPSLDLLYWGVGNPSPPFAGDGRPGDNLFTDSVVALQASTGKLAWYFQFTPHDEHDWDSAQTPILADLLIEGSERKVICWPNRNGFYYVLDRLTGKFLTGRPFVEINWALGLTSEGKPVLANADAVDAGGRLTKPGVAGGANWQPATFDPAQGLIVVHAVEGQSVFTKSSLDRISRGEHGFLAGSGGNMLGPPTNVVRALDAATGVKRWEYYPPPLKGYEWGGMLATAGGLVFGTSRGSLFALDVATGKQLWSFGLGGATYAPPITFTSEGREVIAAWAGRALFLFGLY
jgi:alcohol dehydrogenase (cytochrome c)